MLSYEDSTKQLLIHVLILEGEPGAYRTVSVPRTGLLACSGLDIATLMERRDALEEFAYCRPMQAMQAWVRDRTTYSY